jgi:hypothetical protein
MVRRSEAAHTRSIDRGATFSVVDCRDGETRSSQCGVPPLSAAVGRADNGPTVGTKRPGPPDRQIEILEDLVAAVDRDDGVFSTGRQVEALEELAAALDDDSPTRVSSRVTVTPTGSSRLAGTYRGRHAIGRFIDALHEVLRSSDKPTVSVFDDEGDSAMFRRIVLLVSPTHVVEMMIDVLFVYDDTGYISHVQIQPDDQGLFDYVIDAATAAEPSGS